MEGMVMRMNVAGKEQNMSGHLVNGVLILKFQHEEMKGVDRTWRK